MKELRGARIRSLAAVALGMAVAMLLAGCAQDSSSLVPSSSSGNFTAGSVQIVPLARRQWPVAMAGTTLDGTRLDLASLRGRPVVLNIWGSWCSPCRQEAPELSKAHQRLGPQGVTFVGIDVRDQKSLATAYQHRYKISYPSLVNKGSLMLALHGAASPDAIPTTLVLDAQGRVAGRIVGALNVGTLVSMVQTIGGLSISPAEH